MYLCREVQDARERRNMDVLMSREDTTAWMQGVERIRMNIGHIRVKMSGTYFPARAERIEKGNINIFFKFKIKYTLDLYLGL